ncbi:hypothetical protein [Sodalis sp. RH20]|uniref:hypothetical protein n=1 Tax=unclassified Sodalis (in: enterobacteria) TaxID=2636512 RepID=UPI0039B41FE3
MILILERIKQAINFSRESVLFDINETIVDNEGRLFLKSKMTKSALIKWQEVSDCHCDWLKISFSDIDHDEINPNDGIEGHEHTVKLTYPCFKENAYLFTNEGWSILLHDEKKLIRFRRIRLNFIDTSFSTLTFEALPWIDKPSEDSNFFEEKKEHSRVRSYVKNYESHNLAPSCVEPWILNSLEIENEAFETWKALSCLLLVKCLPDELFYNEDGIEIAGLSGRPPRKLVIDKNNLDISIYDDLQETIKWIYLQGNEIELKHTFLASELAREWPANIDFYSGLSRKLPLALESASLLYKAHIRSSSKETIKTLADLRKTLSEDVQKIVQQTRDISNNIWKDIAIVMGAVIFKYTINIAKSPDLNNIYSFIFLTLGIYMIMSFSLTIYINKKFTNLLEKNRKAWRGKLYGFLDDNDYQTLANGPIEDAIKAYKRVKLITGILVCLITLVLFSLAENEFFGLSKLFRLIYNYIR